jgi:two-component system phosphate regulon sensor histidine kinase PhoR
VLIGLALAVITSGLVLLLLAMRRERKANELKSEFISNVSHELKTPLSIISMFGEMLASGAPAGPSRPPSTPTSSGARACAWRA